MLQHCEHIFVQAGIQNVCLYKERKVSVLQANSLVSSERRVLELESEAHERPEFNTHWE